RRELVERCARAERTGAIAPHDDRADVCASARVGYRCGEIAQHRAGKGIAFGMAEADVGDAACDELRYAAIVPERRVSFPSTCPPVHLSPCFADRHAASRA